MSAGYKATFLATMDTTEVAHHTQQMEAALAVTLGKGALTKVFKTEEQAVAFIKDSSAGHKYWIASE